MNQEQIFKFNMNIAMLQVILKGVRKLSIEEGMTTHDELIKQYNDQIKSVEEDLKTRKLAALAKEKEEKEQLST